jgi:hypothetical protein
MQLWADPDREFLGERNSMENITKPSTTTARGRGGRPLDALVHLAVLLAAAGAVAYGWHQHTETNEREGDTWLEQTSAIRDPWQRYEQLQRDGAVHTERQRERAKVLRHAALAEGLLERRVDQRETVDSDELFDRYPRAPEQRAAHTTALQLVWPKIASMHVFYRAALLRMAARCHLHEAAAPIERQTVLDCLRFGAQSRGTLSVLERLMDSAELGHSLTNAP